MNRATTYLMVFGLAVGSGLSSAHAQGFEAGKEELPSVEVNWSALDRLGAVPTLADRLKGDLPSTPLRQQLAPSGDSRAPVAFQPYKPEKPAASAPAPAKAPVKQAAEKKPAVAVAEPVPAEPVLTESAPVETVKPKAVAAKAEPKPKARPAVPAEPEIPEVVAEPAPAPEAPAKAIAAEPAPQSEPKAPTKTANAKPEPVKPEPVKSEPPASQAKPESIKPESIKPEPAVVAKPDPVAPAITKAEPEPEPEPAPTQAEPENQPAQPAAMAALTPPPAMVSPSASAPAMVSTRGDTMTIRFDAQATRLPDAAEGDLKDLASRLGADEGLNLQLLAYAEGDDAGASKARRLSLSRALEVRKYLMEQGVRSTRIEVRALGHKTDGGHADRVDAILVSR